MYTSVAGKQVGFEFTEARLPALQLGVGHSDEAGPATGAAAVGQGENIDLTAEMTHVQFHAPT